MHAKVIITALIGRKPDDLHKILIAMVNIDYMQNLKEGHIVVFGKKIMQRKPVNIESKYILLITNREPLYRKLFGHFFSELSGDHMNTYKTLFRFIM